MYNTISKGNSKLDKILNFSLPAMKTCPGATELCKKICYATKGHYRINSIKNKYEKNYENTLSDEFVNMMNEDLNSLYSINKENIFRIHTSGDFYNNEYISKWIEIIKKNKKWKFYAYTRSWKCEELLDNLNKLRKLKNVSLIASTDRTSSKPPLGWREGGILEFRRKHKNVKKCYREVSCKQCKQCINGKDHILFMKEY